VVAHIGFPGATLAVLLGVSVTGGLLVFTLGGALAIGALGKRAADREIATGTVLAFATALGVLFASLATTGSTTVTNVLFGNLLAIAPDQLVVFGALTAVMILALAVVFRPLLFASVDPQVAEAKGLPVRLLGVIFMVLLAFVITMSVQVVGTLLLFGLVVTPSATALMITARPSRVILLGSSLSLVSVWSGLVMAAMFNLPPSFFIISVATAMWLAVLAFTRGQRRGRASASGHADSARALLASSSAN
jgi:zinc/manganese transport system permease protein